MARALLVTLIAAVTVGLPLVVLFVFAGRQLVEGIMHGAVKG